MIPSGWQRVSMGSVAQVNPPLPRVLSPEDSVSFLSMADLGTGVRIGHQTRTAQEVLNGFTQFADGDVLIAKITPCFENGKGWICSGLLGGVGFGSTEFIVLRPKDSVDREFLYYHTVAVSFRRSGAASMVGSAGQKRLQPGFVRSYPITLPPLPEQRAIAGVLSTWERGLHQLSELISVKRQARNGLIQNLMGRSVRFPGRAKTDDAHVPLCEVMDKVADPITPAGNEMYREIGVRSHGKGIFHKEPVTGESLGNKRVYRVVPGCLTLNIVFAWERALAITTGREAGMIASHRFPMFRPKPDRLLAEYAMLYFLSTRKGTEALELASPGGAGRNRTLSQTDFLKTVIPLPPIEEQRQIVEFVQTADREIGLLLQQLESLRKQKTALMQKLLTGEVRVHTGREENNHAES